jgi:hypothetical protein
VLTRGVRGNSWGERERGTREDGAGGREGRRGASGVLIALGISEESKSEYTN